MDDPLEGDADVDIADDTFALVAVHGAEFERAECKVIGKGEGVSREEVRCIEKAGIRIHEIIDKDVCLSCDECIGEDLIA